MTLEKVRGRGVLEAELVLLGDMHIGGGSRLDSIADSPIVRRFTSRGMEAYIPGSSLKGKLRHACAQLLGSFGAETGFIDEIFGSAERESKLRFFDSGGVVLEAPEVRYHASLNDMGTVENFFSAEAVPRGKKFGLKIAGKNLEPWQFGLLVAGLKALVDRGMGGECSRGYGTFAVQKISVTLDGKPWEERALLEELRKKLGVERCTG